MWTESPHSYNIFLIPPPNSSLVQWDVPQTPPRPVHPTGGTIHWSNGVGHCSINPPQLPEGNLAACQVRLTHVIRHYAYKHKILLEFLLYYAKVYIPTELFTWKVKISNNKYLKYFTNTLTCPRQVFMKFCFFATNVFCSLQCFKGDMHSVLQMFSWTSDLLQTVVLEYLCRSKNLLIGNFFTMFKTKSVLFFFSQPEIWILLLRHGLLNVHLASTSYLNSRLLFLCGFMILKSGDLQIPFCIPSLWN